MEILRCNNLEKKIKEKTIIEGISFSIHEGEVVGLIGPNGSGKTTIMKLIVGLIKLSKGNVQINGYDIEKNFNKAIEKVGAIIENPDHYMYLSGYDNLKIAANNYKNITKEKINDVIKSVGLENRIKDKVSTYSLGMRQRLGIAEALINNPKVLILDEPTNGLDIEGIIEIRNLIKKLANNGVAILISSHNLSEINNLCNRIIVIKRGRIIENNTVENFHNTNNKKDYSIELNNVERLEKIFLGYKYEIINKEKIQVHTSKEEFSEILQKLIENKYMIYSVNEEKISTEKAFIEKVGENKID